MSETFTSRMIERAANQGTKLLALWRGEAFPFYYVVEYPRSGGTWVAHMLADYLQIPLPKHSKLPIACRAVLHNHWKYHPRLVKPVYVLRDGRDVAVSMMYYALRRIASSYYRHRFPALVGCDGRDMKKRFPRFLREWFEHPAGCRLSWPRHVNDWAFRSNVIVVRYEDFNRDAASALQALLTKLNVELIDHDLIHMTASKFSFQRQTQRRAGQEDRGSNKRKGIIGDWRNYFDDEAAEIFEQYTNRLLIRLNYESNAQWGRGLSHETKQSYQQDPHLQNRTIG